VGRPSEGFHRGDDADRAAVAGVDEADHVRGTDDVERELERGSCAFGREPVAPRLAAQHPSELDAGPAFGFVEADPTEEIAAATILDGPPAVAPQVPVPDEDRHSAPALFTADRFAVVDVPDDLAIAHDLDERLEVVRAERA